LQPVLMSYISTGSNNKWYFWLGFLACFLVAQEGAAASGRP